MDPNAAIIAILDDLAEIHVGNSFETNHHHLVEALAKVNELGIWLERGGNPPTGTLTYEMR